MNIINLSFNATEKPWMAFDGAGRRIRPYSFLLCLALASGRPEGAFAQKGTSSPEAVREAVRQAIESHPDPLHELPLLAKGSGPDPQLIETLESALLSGKVRAEAKKGALEALREIERNAASDLALQLRAPLETEHKLRIGKEGPKTFRWTTRRLGSDAPDGSSNPLGISSSYRLTQDYLLLRDGEYYHHSNPLVSLASDPTLERLWMRTLREGRLDPQREAALRLLAQSRGNEPGVQSLLLALLRPSASTRLRSAAAGGLAWIAETWPPARDGESAVSRATQAEIARNLESLRNNGLEDDHAFRSLLVRALKGVRADDIPSMLAIARQIKSPWSDVRESAAQTLSGALPADTSVQREVAATILRAKDKREDTAIARDACRLLDRMLGAAGEKADPEILTSLARAYLKPAKPSEQNDIIRSHIREVIERHSSHLPEAAHLLLWEGLTAKNGPSIEAVAGLLAKLPPPLGDGLPGLTALELVIVSTLAQAEPKVQAAIQGVLAQWGAFGPETQRAAEHLLREASEYGEACKPGLMKRAFKWLSG